MKKFIIKALIFALPILVYFGYTIYAALVLPLDAYTFRVWEALIVFENNSVLTGPYYPNIHLGKTEIGDLFMGKYTVPKEVVWMTDNYGFRNEGSADEQYEIVIIGDSLTAGSSLTQSEMFSEQLEEALGVNVYPFAPYTTMNRFLKEERFTDHPPKVIIIESAEKLALSLPEITTDNEENNKVKTIWSIIYEKLQISNPLITKLAILNDGLKKEAFTNYLYARISEVPSYIILKYFRGVLNLEKAVSNQTGEAEVEEITRPDLKGENALNMTFDPDPEEHFKQWDEPSIERVAWTLKEYQRELFSMGIKIIFVPVPNKETIYWNLIKKGHEVDNISRLIQATRDAGITTIDLYSTYNEIYRNSPEKLIYHLDDSHWTQYAVEVAVTELLPELERIGY